MKRFLFSSTLTVCGVFVTLSVAGAKPAATAHSGPKIPPPAGATQLKSFATVKATDPAVKSAIPATNLAAAKKKVGQVAAFTGTIAKIYVPRSGKMCLVDFAPNYKNAVIGTVKRADWPKFGSMKNIQGKKVWFKGKVVLYHGAPEVELTAPGMIKIIR